MVRAEILRGRAEVLLEKGQRGGGSENGRTVGGDGPDACGDSWRRAGAWLQKVEFAPDGLELILDPLNRGNCAVERGLDDLRDGSSD